MIQRPSFFDQNGIADLGTLSGASEAHILDCFQQGLYAAKRFNSARPWTLVSECLCADIASLLGLPIPARRIIPFNENWWGLEWRGDAKEYSNGMEKDLIDYTVIPGMIAFDVWVCNRDRHSRNVLFQRPSNGIPKYNLCLIDHSHALIGELANLNTLHQYIQHSNDPQPFVRLVPKNLLSGVSNLNQYNEWLDKIENFDSNQFDEMIKSMPSEWIPDKDQLLELVQLVKVRARNVRALISNNPQLFMH